MEGRLYEIQDDTGAIYQGNELYVSTGWSFLTQPLITESLKKADPEMYKKVKETYTKKGVGTLRLMRVMATFEQ